MSLRSRLEAIERKLSVLQEAPAPRLFYVVIANREEVEVFEQLQKLAADLTLDLPEGGLTCEEYAKCVAAARSRQARRSRQK